MSETTTTQTPARTVTALNEQGMFTAPKSARNTKRFFWDEAKDRCFLIVVDDSGAWDYNGQRVSLLCGLAHGGVESTVLPSDEGTSPHPAATYFGLISFIAEDTPEVDTMDPLARSILNDSALSVLGGLSLDGDLYAPRQRVRAVSVGAPTVSTEDALSAFPDTEPAQNFGEDGSNDSNPIIDADVIE